jgi:hypothetical protein
MDRFIEPVLLNRVIHPTRSVKYLGVLLDAMLTWREHVKQRISKAYSSFWLCYQTLDKTRGLELKIVHWLYTVV